MEHLSKQQIVLLTLFVSFVTSIATGIVTVSLMDQAPSSVTQTITQVVEKTIEKVASEPAATANTASVIASDPNASAVEKAQSSLIRIKPAGGSQDSVLGLGLVVSKDGIIVTDKSIMSSLGDLRAVFDDGEEFPVKVIQAQIDGDIVFVLALIPPDKKSVIKPISISSSIKLGQTVFALSGKNADALSQGIIEKIPENSQMNTETKIETSIDGKNLLIGSPIFGMLGEFIGIKTSSMAKENTFYSLNSLKPSIPIIGS